MTNRDDNNEAVGYGRPPQHTRFKKGQSGNPKGKPKGTQNYATLVLKSLNETVFVTENGERRKITKLEAATKQLANKAAQGDPRATQLTLQLLQMLEERPPSPPNSDALGEADQQVIARIMARMSAGDGQ